MLRCCAFSLLALVLAVPAARAADAYPSRPVHLIIPFPPGGSNDVVGRVFAAALGERLGQTVVVENRSGAGGNIGAAAVAMLGPTSQQFVERLRPQLWIAPAAAVITVLALLKLGDGPAYEFIYFRF